MDSIRKAIEALEAAQSHHMTTSLPRAIERFGSVEAFRLFGAKTWYELVPDALSALKALEAGSEPNLWPVIQWLEGGCDPKHAAIELRLYAAKLGQPDPAGVKGRCARVGEPCECAPEARSDCVSWRPSGVMGTSNDQPKGGA